MLLSEACSVSTGYTARSRLEAVAEGGVPAIQLRDISAEGWIDPIGLTRVDLGGLAERYFVRHGDIVFRSRGDCNTASALDDRFSELSVPISPLIILRPKSNAVLPEYLAWAINQPEAQRKFDTEARGTSIRMVPKSSLEALDIEIPDLGTQLLIVKIHVLAMREHALLQKLAEQRKTWTNVILAERAKSARQIAQPKRKSK
jgi:hypothetical protein